MAEPKMSRKEKNALKKQQDDVARIEAMKASHDAEKSKVRAMTLDQLVLAIRQLIIEQTGLGIEIHQPRGSDDYFEFHVHAKAHFLGYMSVSKSSDGSYMVGGVKAGCFMANNDENCIYNRLADKFKALEASANAEKAA